MYDRLMAMKGIDNVVYRKALLELIDERTASVNNLTLGLGVLVSLSAIFFVSNTSGSRSMQSGSSSVRWSSSVRQRVHPVAVPA